MQSANMKTTLTSVVPSYNMHVIGLFSFTDSERVNYLSVNMIKLL